MDGPGPRPDLPETGAAELRRVAKLIGLLTAMVLAAAACSDTAAEPTATPPPPTPPPPTRPPLTAPVTVPPPTTTTTTRPLLPNPLTNTEVSQEQLMLMAGDDADLRGIVAGYRLDQRLNEPNAEAARKSLLDPGDEADDIEAFARESGARAVYKPRTAPDQGVTEVHVWVHLFADEAGASGYLDDWFLDATKGIGGGHPAALRITSVAEFTVQDVGDESLGVVLEESVPGDAEPQLYETLVAFRIGRLLVFTSLVSEGDDDLRIPVIQLADLLEDRALAVLRGTIRPPEPPPPATELRAFAFEFAQRVFRPRTKVEAEASGIVVRPDRVQCEVNVAVDDFPEVKRYVAIGDRAWYDLPEDLVPGLTETDRSTDFVTADLLFCPGWTVLAEDSGLNFAVADAVSAPTEVGGRAGLSYRLGSRELRAMGYLPFESEIDVDRFDVVLDATEPWVLSLDIELSGLAPQFVAAFGDEFAAGERDQVRMELSLRVTRINDPELAVEEPG